MQQTVIVSAVFLLSGVFTAPQSAEKKRVALYDFDHSTVRASLRAEVGRDMELGRTAAQMLVGPLTQGGTYDVIDRARMQQIFAEQNLRFSDRFDPAKAASYGRILGVDAIITGTIDNVYVEQKQSTKGLFGIGKKSNQLKATVEITAQMISTATAQVVLAPSAVGEVTEDIGNEISGDVPGVRRRPSPSGSGSKTTARNPAEPLIRKATRQALEKIAEEMVQKTSALPTFQGKGTTAGRTPARPSGTGVAGGDKPEPKPVESAEASSVEGRVLKISANTVYLNRGSRAGLQQGSTFQVRRTTETIKDPDTGKDIQLSEQIGTIVLTEVSEDWSAGTFTGKLVPKAGDRITLSRQSTGRRGPN